MGIPYKKIPRAVRPSTALLALMGTAAVQYLAITADFEGYVPEGYRDPVGIPTKCFGDTTGVKLGKKYSFEECERSLNEHSVEIIRPVRECIKDFDKLPDKTKAALASMAYNIGPDAMCKSSVVKYANAKNYTRMCSRISEIYLYATDRKTGKKKELRGLKLRREKESALCREGFEEEKEGKDEKAAVAREVGPTGDRVSAGSSGDLEHAKGQVVRESPGDIGIFGRIRVFLNGCFH